MNLSLLERLHEQIVAANDAVQDRLKTHACLVEQKQVLEANLEVKVQTIQTIDKELRLERSKSKELHSKNTCIAKEVSDLESKLFLEEDRLLQLIRYTYMECVGFSNSCSQMQKEIVQQCFHHHHPHQHDYQQQERLQSALSLLSSSATKAITNQYDQSNQNKQRNEISMDDNNDNNNNNDSNNSQSESLQQQIASAQRELQKARQCIKAVAEAQEADLFDAIAHEESQLMRLNSCYQDLLLQQQQRKSLSSSSPAHSTEHDLTSFEDDDYSKRMQHKFVISNDLGSEEESTQSTDDQQQQQKQVRRQHKRKQSSKQIRNYVRQQRYKKARDRISNDNPANIITPTELPQLCQQQQQHNNYHHQTEEELEIPFEYEDEHEHEHYLSTSNDNVNCDSSNSNDQNIPANVSRKQQQAMTYNRSDYHMHIDIDDSSKAMSIDTDNHLNEFDPLNSPWYQQTHKRRMLAIATTTRDTQISVASAYEVRRHTLQQQPRKQRSLSTQTTNSKAEFTTANDILKRNKVSL